MRATKLIWIALCAGLVLLLESCGNSPHSSSIAPPGPPLTKTAPPTPIALQKAELGGDTWNPEWDKIIEDDLPKELLSNQVASDVHPFCPNFKNMSDLDRKAFWAYFFQALAGAEAGLKPTANVRHTEPEVAVVDGVTHRMVRSEGLLQLTYEDSARYGCDFDWDSDRKLPEHDPAKTILQPRNNLTCGVTILSNQLIAQKRPLVTRYSYWSTLRPGGSSYPVFRKQMANVPSVCRLPAAHPRPGKPDTRVAAAAQAGTTPTPGSK